MTTSPGYAAVSVEMHHTLMSRSAYITFGANPSGTDVSVMVANVGIALQATGSLRSIVDNGVTFRNITVRYGIDGADDQLGTGVYSFAGSNAQTSLPPNCAVLVYKRTARGSRRGRGRMYLPWVLTTSDVTEDGQIAATKITSMQTAVEVFRAALATNDMPMVVLHRPSLPSTQNPTSMGAPDPVTLLEVDSMIATQRRRLGHR